MLLGYVTWGTDAWCVDLKSVGFIRTQSPDPANKKKAAGYGNRVSIL